jgi:hypothetical protein
MHARPRIREAIISQKMKRWCRIARFPLVYPSYSQARARKNFHRLCVRYPEIAARLGFTEVSVYPPI